MAQHILAAALFAIGALELGGLWHWYRVLARAVGRPVDRSAPPAQYPSVTMVRPVRGRDVEAEANFRAALDNSGYPGEVETLFVFDDESDPAYPIAQRVVAEHYAAGRPGKAWVLIAGPRPAGYTGKLYAMMVGARRARGELLGFGDSDTRPDRAVLRGVVDALLTTPGAGSAFAPAVVDHPPHRAGDAMYAIMQNALYAPVAAHAAGTTRTLPFIMGQLMVFRRDALSAIGGVEVARGMLVDDMAIGMAMHRAGYTNAMSDCPLQIVTGGMSLREFLPVYKRWIAFSRNGLPLSFKWPQWAMGIAFYAALVVAAVAWATTGIAAAAPALAALVLAGASQLDLNRRSGGAAIPLRWSWTAWAAFLLGPVMLAENLVHKQVEWRGRAYGVDARGISQAVTRVTR